jgi:hypothetical protein
MSGAPLFVGGIVLLGLGIALILIPPYATSLGILLMILSSIPFALSYSASMRGN